MEKETIVQKVTDILCNEFLQDSGADQLNNDSALISSGLMDSISTLRLVDRLEREFGIRFKPHEVDKDNLNTIELISSFILSKLGK